MQQKPIYPFLKKEIYSVHICILHKLGKHPVYEFWSQTAYGIISLSDFNPKRLFKKIVNTIGYGLDDFNYVTKHFIRVRKRPNRKEFLSFGTETRAMPGITPRGLRDITFTVLDVNARISYYIRAYNVDSDELILSERVDSLHDLDDMLIANYNVKFDDLNVRLVYKYFDLWQIECPLLQFEQCADDRVTELVPQRGPYGRRIVC